MGKPTEVEQILCPVYSHRLKLIALINLTRPTLEELDQGSTLTVEVAPDPKAIQVENPDPKTNQIELTMSLIKIGLYATATFFAEDPEKALRLPCAFAPGQALAIAETYNTGFKAGISAKENRAARRAR